MERTGSIRSESKDDHKGAGRTIEEVTNDPRQEQQQPSIISCDGPVRAQMSLRERDEAAASCTCMPFVIASP